MVESARRLETVALSNRTLQVAHAVDIKAFASVVRYWFGNYFRLSMCAAGRGQCRWVIPLFDE